ncbi:hypothetical protein [Prevotella lacticifex]|uniref:Uncharacterized protein n=1 Tax=Prevotella lacticifex TaxID=2854755 RepID=A0A9R1CY49_9BACT|nr:hypothetical protein [Prevotella lacticifex]GJG35382.1 hypothetical protein PRLR5003_05390 [Prevotella lacticifex]GJG39567.1 hypothetical protein PRLR5019_15380 [Prevotella lacticifex]GJG41751.1 hypothetical protein PRLR5025_05370 [Prevotella lacticifex]GJG45924.1 hypothetical protein PRLR5027_15190 [Prevotella lacticifex]GJG48102.1 hypothetical protein PRLR5052_05150 [Prevotella lacticifex]
MAIAIPLAATKELIADVAELKGLYIFRYIKGRQLPRRFRAVGGGKAGIGGRAATQTAKSLILGGLRFLTVENSRKTTQIAA